jgi:CRP-like cAMP-binding protein/CheY-like chemotaxis protein
MKTILIIEDNQDVRENTAEILELANYNVIQTANGREGVDMAQKTKPDLIICDIMMPELDGYGVIHLLNKNKATANIPFIFLSAKGERSDFRKGMEMGADDYISKPFDDIELLKAVESRFKKNEMIKAEYSNDVEGLSRFFDKARSFVDLKKLSAERRVKKYRKKEMIFTEGSSPLYLYMLVSGKVKTYRTHQRGKELITTLLRPGDFFGYQALLEERSYDESAEALEDAEVCLIPKEDFYSLLHQNPEVMQAFIKMLSGNVSEKEKQLLSMAYNSVRRRVAEALLRLEERYRQPGKTFSISIPREDLANMVGTATESLIRTLSDFKDEKLIEVSGSNITISNPDKLSGIRG